jgi:hypothetical protein
MKSFKKEQDALGHGRPGARSSPRMNSPCQQNWFIIYFWKRRQCVIQFVCFFNELMAMEKLRLKFWNLKSNF